MNIRPKQKKHLHHYWPADKVPYIGISYCDLVQYIFALLLISFIGIVIFGLNDPSQKLQLNQIKQKDNNQKTKIKEQIFEREKDKIMISDDSSLKIENQNQMKAVKFKAKLNSHDQSEIKDLQLIF